LAERLATVLVAGELTASGVRERTRRALGRSYRWLDEFANNLSNRFQDRTRPTSRRLTKFLLDDATLLLAASRHKLTISASHVESPVMAPARFARDWRVPSLTTERELAEWLETTPSR